MGVNLVVAIVGEDNDVKEVLFKGFNNFLPSKVILLAKEKYQKKAEKISKSLSERGIEPIISKISNSITLEEIFIKIREISNSYSDFNIVLNVDTDYITSCLCLSSAFVSGVQAIGILGDEIVAYPIMKFSYYNAINKKKMEIIKALNKKGHFDSMDELSKYINMSLPLLAYHLRGNRDSVGLIEMKLVEAQKNENYVKLRLTDLGSLIAKGYIDYKES